MTATIEALLKRQVVTPEGDAQATQGTLLAHEQDPGTANAIGRSVPKCNVTVVDVSTTSTDVSGGVPATLLGVYVNTDIAVEAVGIHDGAGGSEYVTLPIGLAAGKKVEFNGIQFSNALFVEATAATGSIAVEWWPS